jgi:hypothetical protein
MARFLEVSSFVPELGGKGGGDALSSGPRFLVVATQP